MEKPFDFDALPKEITDVLQDVIHWRIALEAGLMGVATMHAEDLDRSSEAFKEWCSRQGRLRQRELQHDEVAVTQKRVPGRQERQRRIAKSALSLVEGDT